MFLSSGHVGAPIPCNIVKLVDVEDMNYFASNGEGEVSGCHYLAMLQCMEKPKNVKAYFSTSLGFCFLQTIKQAGYLVMSRIIWLSFLENVAMLVETDCLR